MKKILITGANGQIGSELVPELQKKYGYENVIATDIVPPKNDNSIFEILNVLDKEALDSLLIKYNIDTIFNLAAILSANGENNPNLCWDVNMNGLRNVLESAKENKVKSLFCPSTIAVFGASTPKHNVAQQTILEPNTVYGITKLSGELLCRYYVDNFDMDIRGLRYPGIISYKTLPGGGTTDYAVDIYYKAVEQQHYECFVNEETRLPMMYMADCVAATIQLMEADATKLTKSVNYNLAGISVSVSEFVQSIQKHIPDFQLNTNLITGSL